VGLAIAARLFSGPAPVDDAYITFRYARNLAEGNGLVFNLGQLVLGTSTPLYAVLLAPAARIFGSGAIPHIAFWVNTAADALLILVLYRVCARLQLSAVLAMAATCIQALAPLAIRYSIGGMETSLVTAVTLAAFAGFLADRTILSANLAGLAIFLRPDMALVSAILLVASYVNRKRLPWRGLLITFAWVVLLGSTLWFFYGSPVPHSVLAKSSPIYLASPFTNARQFLFHFAGLIVGAPFGFAAKGNLLEPDSLVLLPVVLAFFPQSILWGLGVFRAAAASRYSIWVFLYPAAYAGIYGLLGLRGSLIAEWYLIPLIPFYVLPILLGLQSILQKLAPRTSGAWEIGALILLVGTQVLGLNLGRLDDRNFAVPLAAWQERELLYKEAAEFLVPRLNEGDVVAASEIGALGYFCECTILDTVGLVSPEALQYYPLPSERYLTNNAIPPALIQDAEPEYVVSLESQMRNSLLADPWFLQHYCLLWSADTDAFGSRGMLIYRHCARR
jgi:hypothetical protein